MTAPPAARPEGSGFVTPPFERGALLLRDEAKRVWRLSWEGEAGADRRRALPAGRYELIGYRIVRARGDDVWHVSASAPSIETVKIAEGATKELDVDPTIRLGIRRHGGRLAVSVRGHEKAGLSIYRNGARIPLGWAAYDADGELLAEGPVEYG